MVSGVRAWGRQSRRGRGTAAGRPQKSLVAPMWKRTADRLPKKPRWQENSFTGRKFPAEFFWPVFYISFFTQDPKKRSTCFEKKKDVPECSRSPIISKAKIPFWERYVASLTILRRLFRLPGAGGLPGAGTRLLYCTDQANVECWQRDHDVHFRRSRN